MARIVLGSYLVQFPLGGYLSWVLQWLVGLRDCGNEAAFVDKSLYIDSCYHASRKAMTSDASYGTRTVREALGRFGFDDLWCFVDTAGKYHGMTRASIEEFFRPADLFIDMGSYGALAQEPTRS